MKHFYTFFLMFVMAVLPGFAAEYILDIDHADRVRVSAFGQTIDLTDGENTLDLDDPYGYGISLNIETVSSDYGIASIVKRDGTALTSIYGNQAYCTFDENNKYYKVTTSNLVENRTATLTVICDEPTKFGLRLDGTSRVVTFTETNNVVKFDPEKEASATLYKNNYEDVFYKVQLNGEDVPEQYGSYYLEYTDGSTLEVSMKAPDVDYNYTITEMPGAEGFVSAVKVGGVAVSDPKSFKAHAGEKVEIEALTSSYIFEKMEFGAQTLTYFYSPYSFTATADTHIKIHARKPGSFTASFDIDDPANVTIGLSNSSSSPFSLRAGTQDIKFEEDNYGSSITIYIKATGIGTLKSVKRNDIELYNGYDIYTQVNKDDKFVIVTEKITRDWNGVLYVEGVANSHFLSFNHERTQIVANPTDGYNMFTFGNVDLPISLGFYPKDSSASPAVYINGDKAEPENQGSYTYQLNPADGDVIKVFINKEPESYDLAFDMPEKTDGISVRRDHLTTISDFAMPSTSHAGTVYHLTVPDASVYTATLGDTPLTFDESNTAEFTPKAHSTLKVEAIQDGIEDITAGANAPSDVYNLQGIRVGDSTEGLPSGIYIVGSKKVYVK